MCSSDLEEPLSDSQSQSSSSTESILIPGQIVQYIDPDLVAEGEVVATPHTTMRVPSSGLSAPTPRRSIRFQGGDSLQKLGN